MLLILRAILTLAMLGLIAYAGFRQQQYSTVALVFAPVFTLAYIDSKLSLWQTLIRESGPLKVLTSLAATLLIQLAVVSIVYFVAFGISSAFFSATGFVAVPRWMFGGVGAIATASLLMRLGQTLQS